MLRPPWEPNSPSRQAEARGDGRGTSQRREQFPAFVEREQRSCKHRPQHLMCVSPSYVSTRSDPTPSPSKENSGSSRTKSLQIISFPIIGCKVLKIIRYLNQVLSRLLRTIRGEYRALPQTGIKRSPNKINCLT
jgi:hypothetical protein